MVAGTVLQLDERRRRNASPRLSVIIPALNEALNLGWLLPRLPSDLYEVILVDGRSHDGTVAVARALRPDIRIIEQPRAGKGDALLAGFAEARGDILVTLDADGSADPSELGRFVDALVLGADFAKGSRFVSGGGSTDITRIRRYGNRLLTRITRLFHGTQFTDLCYGYNAFWRRCVPDLALGTRNADAPGRRRGDGFEIETLLNIRAVRAGLRVVEVPSFERERRHGRTNLHAVSDGWRVLRTIVAERWGRTARARQHPDEIIDLTARPARQATVEGRVRSPLEHLPSVAGARPSALR